MLKLSSDSAKLIVETDYGYFYFNYNKEYPFRIIYKINLPPDIRDSELKKAISYIRE